MMDWLRCNLTKLLERENHPSKLHLQCVSTRALKLIDISHLGGIIHRSRGAYPVHITYSKTCYNIGAANSRSKAMTRQV